MRGKKAAALFAALAVLMMLSGCASSSAGDDLRAEPEQTPQKTASAKLAKRAEELVPDRLDRGEDGVPILAVYRTEDETIARMSVEDYLPAVLAGEMAGDWPLEALRAQAILARTFVLQFVTEKKSMYEGADISTDIREAQAYDDSGINERIREAVKGTRGLVLNADGMLPYAWFHAHSGGLTARAKEGLDYEKAEPSYTQCAEGMEDDEAPAEAARWRAEFTADEVIEAARHAGASVGELTDFSVGVRGESGRAQTLIVSGREVSAPAFRIAIGSTEMRSCLLEEARLENGRVVMKGRGYGHGVGMSQWGAYAMARQGKTAEEIIGHFFRDVVIDKAWQ